MAFINGDPFVSGSLLSFQQGNRMLQNFRGATVPLNLQAGALWSGSSDDRLWHQGASELLEVFTEKTTLTFENLLSNTGVGVWSQSDAAKGLCTIAYDTGAKGAGAAPSVGDAVVGANGATAKVISYTTATGTWAGGDAAGVLTLGACTGGWTDNEVLTFGGVETAAINGESIGIVNDPCNNDGTGDWTDADAILSFDTDHYEIASDLADEATYITSLTFIEGKIYKVEAQLKDGTAAPTDVELVSLDGAVVEQASAPINTTAAFVTYSCTFEATSGTDGVGIRTPTSLAGNNIEMKYFICYEITPCCTDGNALAFDGYDKDTTLDIYREHQGSNTKDGSYYALKLVPHTALDLIKFPGANLVDSGAVEHYFKYQQRTVTFGAWIKTAKASHVRLAIYDGAYDYSSYHTGGGTMEWLEVTATIGAAATDFQVRIICAQTGEVGGDTIVYVSQPMLVFGSSIGEGNYQPKPQEVIFTEAYINSNRLNAITAESDVAFTTLNIEADSDGRLPKGCKSVFFYLKAYDSGSATVDCWVKFRSTAAQAWQLYCSIFGKANSSYATWAGWQDCGPEGDVDYNLEATGVGTLGMWCRYMGVQLN